MIMKSITKKRKIAEEKRKFNIPWTKKYFVSKVFGNRIRLICNKISVCKEYNMKRHCASINMSANIKNLMKKEEKRKLKN